MKPSSIGRALLENFLRVNSLIKWTLTAMVKYLWMNLESSGESQRATVLPNQRSWKSCRTYRKEKHGSASTKCQRSEQNISPRTTDQNKVQMQLNLINTSIYLYLSASVGAAESDFELFDS